MLNIKESKHRRVQIYFWQGKSRRCTQFYHFCYYEKVMSTDVGKSYAINIAGMQYFSAIGCTFVSNKNMQLSYFDSDLTIDPTMPGKKVLPEKTSQWKVGSLSFLIK